MENKLGMEGAFPLILDRKDLNIGMSKRLYIATQLMSGRIAADRIILDIVYTVKAIYKITDELLKQENL